MSELDADGNIRLTPAEAAIVVFYKLQQWGADIEVGANYAIRVDLTHVGAHPFDSVEELREFIEYFRGPLEAVIWAQDQRVH